MRKRIQRLIEYKNAGATLAIVIAVCALLTVFALTITYAASLLMANAQARRAEDHCYQLAKSFATVLDADLTSTENTVENSNNKSTSFYLFVNRFMNSSDYRTDEVYSYAVDSSVLNTDAYGEVSVNLTKVATEGAVESEEGEISSTYEGVIDITSENQDFSESIHKIEGNTVTRYTLTVEVVLDMGDISYHYATDYDKHDTYKVEYFYGGETVYWNGNRWNYFSTGAPASLNIGNKITYQYLVDGSALNTMYRDVYAEGGME